MPVGAIALHDHPSPTAVAMATLASAAVDVEPRPDSEQRVDTAILLARDIGGSLPLPGEGDTLTLWESLASLGAADLTVARVVEPHLDALAILAQAGAPVEGMGLWGVYAAEGGPRPLTATAVDGHWQLDGFKPWCSLADRAGHALVTAWVEERRGLFAVDLHAPGVRADRDASWAARGLSAVRSTGLVLDRVAARPVGEPEWYLERPGFAWGGIGVAAVWYGAAVGLARRLLAAARSRDPDQVALMHLGATDAALHRARAVLREAAVVADGDDHDRELAERTALRARQVVCETAEEVLARVAHALGPGPLTGEEEHARRVADLTVYVRQHHAERDLARLGARVLLEESPW